MSKEQQLFEYLMEEHVGQENAIHSKELEKFFKINPRTVRTYVSNLRKSGIPVCSDATGYWIARNPKEANKTVKHLDDFVGGINSARTGLAVAAVQMSSITRITEEHVLITVKVG